MRLGDKKLGSLEARRLGSQEAIRLGSIKLGS
jgi:hypothetical protein